MNRLKKTIFAVLGIGAAVAGAWRLHAGGLRRIAASRPTLCQTAMQCPSAVFEWVEDPLTPEQYRAAEEAARLGGCVHYGSKGHYRITGFTVVNDPEKVLARAGIESKP